MKDVFTKEQRDALRRLGVTAVYLFGSRAEGTARELSDYDVAVLIHATKEPRNTSTLYNALFRIFSDVFDLSGFKTIDIVFLQHAPLELQFDVIRHGKILMDDDPDARVEFEDRTQMLYMDFKPVLTMMDRAVLARI